MGICHSKSSKPRVAVDVFAKPDEQQDDATKASSTGSTISTESTPPKPSDQFTFHELAKVYTVGTDCVLEEEDLGLVCGRINAVNNAKGGLGGKLLCISLLVIRSNGNVFCRVPMHATVQEYSGKRMLSELALRPIQAEEKAKLKERGKLFSKYGLGNKENGKH